MKNSHAKAVVFGPLTFEIHTLGDWGLTREYGVEVFMEGDEAPPFRTQFKAYGPKQPIKQLAWDVLQDLHLALRNPDELWKKESEKAKNVHPEDQKMVRESFDQMVAWASKRPDLVRTAVMDARRKL